MGTAIMGAGVTGASSGIPTKVTYPDDVTVNVPTSKATATAAIPGASTATMARVTITAGTASSSSGRHHYIFKGVESKALGVVKYTRGTYNVSDSLDLWIALTNSGISIRTTTTKPSDYTGSTYPIPVTEIELYS